MHGKLIEVEKRLGIKECWEEKLHTYYRVEGTPERIIKFDNVYTKWMRALYRLIFHIASERDRRLIDVSRMENTPKYQFFGLAEGVADQLMYFFVKDQISDIHENNELNILCYNILSGEISDVLPTQAVFGALNYKELMNYLEKIVCYEFNSFTSAQFYDFYISYWSCFEACINKICEPYEAEIREKLNNSQFKEMKKFLNGLYKDLPNREKIIKEFEDSKETFNKKFGKYISFTDKYTYLLKNIINKHYCTRDPKKDIDILEFCGAFRNTVHNNGTHLKSDKQIEIRGVTFSLEENEKTYSDDFSQIFVLAQEIFDIYVAIIDALDVISNDGLQK